MRAVTIDADELLFLLWAQGFTVPEEQFESMLNQAKAVATVTKRIRKSEALFVDSSIEIEPTTRAAFVATYSRYTTKRGYKPLIRNDWTIFQRELSQLQVLAARKDVNVAMEMENIFRAVFTSFVSEREFKAKFAQEIQRRHSAMSLDEDINSNVFKQLQEAYIKLAKLKGLHEYVAMANASLEPFAKLVDLADSTNADLTNLFYAQFEINWGREFPKPSNLHDMSAMGRYADYCAKLKSNAG
jgi:hypothetical protein